MTPKYNLQLNIPLEEIYNKGYLPQRNQKNSFYLDSSCRSALNNFLLNSENRRILKKTESFKNQLLPLKDFVFDKNIQKTIFSWIKELSWDFPISSVKNIFLNHIFNYVYVWKFEEKTIAYSICYFDNNISHIAYVFYDPQFDHSNLPIRLVLQTIIDSKEKNLKYCYLGRFSKEIGYYKRNMPGFEYFINDHWQKL